jgi:hypothetical protein
MVRLLQSADDLLAYFEAPKWNPDSLPQGGEWGDVDHLLSCVERFRLPNGAVPKRAFDAVVMAACIMRNPDLVQRARTVVADAVAAALTDLPWERQALLLERLLPGAQRTPAGVLVPFEPCLEGLERAPERLRFRYLSVHAGKAALATEHLRLVLRHRLLADRQPFPPRPVPGWARTGLAAPLKKLHLLRRRELHRGKASWKGVPQSDVFPPCIQEFLRKAKNGLDHGERYNLVAFLGYFGMPPEQIVELFAATPGFDRRKTEYQVHHITRGGRTDGKYAGYHPMGCRQLKDRGYCPSQTCPGPSPVRKCEADLAAKAKHLPGAGKGSSRQARTHRAAFMGKPK